MWVINPTSSLQTQNETNLGYLHSSQQCLECRNENNKLPKLAKHDNHTTKITVTSVISYFDIV